MLWSGSHVKSVVPSAFDVADVKILIPTQSCGASTKFPVGGVTFSSGVGVWP